MIMASNKKILKLMLDYLQGPIWISDFQTGEPLTGIEIVDSDPILAKLNLECGKLYSSCYEFSSCNCAVSFNDLRLKDCKSRILFLLGKINDRLSEINDGSFEVEDSETCRIKEL